MTAAFEELALRLTDLETRIAYYEHMAEEMSDVLASQAITIERLSLQLRQMKEQKDVDSEWTPSPQDGKPPPHY